MLLENLLKPMHIGHVATIPKVLECFRKKEHIRAFEIQDRLHACIDLAAAEAVYHNSCSPGSKSN